MSSSKAELLASKWMAEQISYPNDPEGQAAAAAVRLCAKELLAIKSDEPAPSPDFFAENANNAPSPTKPEGAFDTSDYVIIGHDGVPRRNTTKPEGLGWKLVPIEPTEQMLDAYWKQTGESQEMRSRTHAYMRRYWASMLAVSPVSDADTVRVKRDTIRDAIDCITDLGSGKGGWAWENVTDDLRAAIGGEK